MKIRVLRSCVVALAALACALPLTSVAAPKKVLVVTVTTGFRHASIPTAEKILAQFAKDTGDFTVDFVQQPPGAPKAPAQPKVGPKGKEDPAYQDALKRYQAAEPGYRQAFDKWLVSVAEALKPLNAENLAKYDAVVFASTTGDLPLPDRMAFLKWIAAGHAFIGVHAAGDTFHGFPAFIEMIGGEFMAHGPQVAVDCVNEDPAHPAARMLPARWPVFDEIYQFKNYDRAKVHMLVSIQELATGKEPDQKPGRFDPMLKTKGYFPVSWCKRYGSGRVFYTSLGHRDDVWDPAAAEGGNRRNSPELSKKYQEHLLGGIRWALGLAEGSAEPQAATGSGKK